MRSSKAGASAPKTRQGGAGAAAFLLAALPILMLGAGGIEAAHWLFLRQTLSHVLFDAGRAAATRHGQPAALAQAFEDALRVLHPDPRQRHAALAQRRQALDGPPWRIRILRPTRAAFQDHGNTDIRVAAGSPARDLMLIRNDRQPEQHAGAQARGWPGGRGPVSGSTIFEANTLELELTWPQRPLLPGVAALLRGMAASAPPGDYRQRVLAQGWLPIVRRVTLSMHSHPAQWPDLPDGRVIHGALQSVSVAGNQPGCPGHAGCATQWPGSAPGATADPDGGPIANDSLLPVDSGIGADGQTPAGGDSPDNGGQAQDDSGAQAVADGGTGVDGDVADEMPACDPPLP